MKTLPEGKTAEVNEDPGNQSTGWGKKKPVNAWGPCPLMPWGKTTTIITKTEVEKDPGEQGIVWEQMPGNNQRPRLLVLGQVTVSSGTAQTDKLLDIPGAAVKHKTWEYSLGNIVRE